MSREKDHLWPIFFGTGVLAGIIATGFIPGMPWTPVVASPQIWLGTGGLIGAGVSVFTLAGVVAAGVGVFLNNRNTLASLESSRQRERLERFERHVALIGSEQVVSRIAGAKLLVELAVEFPEQFAETARVVLESSAHQHSEKDYNITEKTLTEIRRFDILPVKFTAISTIVQGMCDINDIVLDKKPVYLEGIFFSYLTLTDEIIYKISLNNAIIYRLDFVRCDLIDARIHYVCADNLSFIDCNLNKSKFENYWDVLGKVIFKNCDLSNSVIHLQSGNLEFVNCKMDEVKIVCHSASLEDCWTERVPPTIKISNDADQFNARVAVSNAKSTYKNSRRGLPILIIKREKMLSISADDAKQDREWRA